MCTGFNRETTKFPEFDMKVKLAECLDFWLKSTARKPLYINKQYLAGYFLKCYGNVMLIRRRITYKDTYLNDSKAINCIFTFLQASRKLQVNNFNWKVNFNVFCLEFQANHTLTYNAKHNVNEFRLILNFQLVFEVKSFSNSNEIFPINYIGRSKNYHTNMDTHLNLLRKWLYKPMQIRIKLRISFFAS